MNVGFPERMKLQRGAKRNSLQLRTTPAVLRCLHLCFFFIFALANTATCLEPTTPGSKPYIQVAVRLNSGAEVMFGLPRRAMVGPGSYPPQCTAKCGVCTPCRPVQVPVPPGMPVTAEYYPEAWLCKCGNRLYTP